MALWSAEIRELERLYEFFKGQLPDLEKELERLIKADDENMILIYSRRCLEVIITDLCECELNRERGTEPLKGIIDKLHKEKKVPSNIITSMDHLNSLSAYGAHPKDFDPEQVKPVLNNLDIIIKWYLKYKNLKADVNGIIEQRNLVTEFKKGEGSVTNEKPVKTFLKILMIGSVVSGIVIVAAILVYPKIFKRDTLGKLRSSGERISVAVMPFQNMTNDTTWNVWQNGIQDILITSLSNNPELNMRQIESITSLIQSRSLSNYASITPSTARMLSKKLDANIFINGSINQAGSTIRLNVLIVDSQTENVLKSFQIDGMPENILETIDSLSVRVKNFLIISELEKGVSADYHSYASTTSPEAYRNYICGVKAYNRTDFPIAISFFTQALEIDTNFIPPSILLVWANHYIGRTDLAKEIALKNYLQRDKLSFQYAKLFIDYNYAVFFETPSDEIKCIRQMQQLDDRNPQSHFLIGVSYTELQQYDKAIPEYEKTLDIYDRWSVNPAWIKNYLKLGYAYHKTGQYRKEKKIYKTAEKIFHDDPSLLYRQAILALSVKDTKMADKYIDKYKSVRKGNSESEDAIKLGMAEIHSEAGIYDKAEEYYREATTYDLKGTWSRYNLAFFLIDKDRNVREGLELIDKLLESNPDDFNYLDAKGWGLYKQGKYQEALEILQKSWDLRREKAIYDHKAFLRLEAAKKAVTGQIIN